MGRSEFLEGFLLWGFWHRTSERPVNRQK